jgi:NTE family protein
MAATPALQPPLHTGNGSGNGRPVFRRPTPAPRAVLAIASLGVFMAFVDATIVNIAFPDIERSFSGSSIGTLSWVLNAYNIVFAAFLVAAGRLADLLGRRRIFLLALMIFTASSALCAAAPTAGALIGFRVLQALGAALLVPASLALVLDAFPADQRSHAVALFSAVGALAAGVGPSLGGLLISVSNWRLVFLVNVPIGIAAYALSRSRLIESRAPGRRRMPDLPGTLVFAVAIAALVLGVVKGEEWGWSSGRVLGCFGAALVLGAIFVRRCRRHRSPIVDLQLLRIRTFSTANAMTILAAAGFYGYTLANVLFLTGVWQYSILEAGLAITPGPFVAAAVAGPTSRLTERIGHRPVLIAGGVIWGAALLWFVLRTGVRPDFVGIWLPGMVFLGIGAGILFPNLSAAAVSSAPGESFAAATGLNSVARQLGAALGVAIVIAIIGTPAPQEALAAFHNAWTFSAAALLLAGLGCVAVGRLRTGAAAEPQSLGAAARAVLAPVPDAAPAVRPVPARREATPGLRAPGPPETTAQFLASVPIFSGLSEALREQLATRSETVRLGAGEWLFRAGEPGDAMYVVRAGRLEVVAEEERSEALLRVLGRGAAVGELALLTSETRSASVRATRPTDLIAIQREPFEQLLREAPELSLGLTRALGAQLRDSRGAIAEIRPLPVAIAILALDDRVPVNEIAHRLLPALDAHAPAAILDGSEARTTPDASNAAAVYAPLLDRCAAAAEHVILAAGIPWSDDPWTRFCLQQSERVLVVGSGGPLPEEARLTGLGGCDLVAWDVADGSGALAEWAEALDPTETHVLRPGAALDDDLERMARRLTGNSVGVVLSGGGARAFSHIGVLEELTAAGVAIDRVAGVSMGALIGAMFAMGMDPDEIDARCFDEWVRRRPLGDYAVPRYGLIRGERVLAMLNRSFGVSRVEELERSFLSGSADLRTGELVVARHGRVQDVVARSMCIPVLAPPRIHDGRILVDGALVDNLPIDTMAALGEGPLIAVDVKASVESSRRRDGNVRLPPLGETLMRVILVGSSNTSQAARRHADLIVKPRNEGVGLLEFHQLDRAREAGRAAAREALENAPASLFA